MGAAQTWLGINSVTAASSETTSVWTIAHFPFKWRGLTGLRLPSGTDVRGVLISDQQGPSSDELPANVLCSPVVWYFTLHPPTVTKTVTPGIEP